MYIKSVLLEELSNGWKRKYFDNVNFIPADFLFYK